MKPNELRTRLQKNRPMVMVSIRMPEDIVADLKRIAPQLGFSGYQPLMRAYIGQGLREDLERLEEETAVSQLIQSLRRQGVGEDVLQTAVAESRASYHVPGAKQP
ncbi:MAG: hypothetical protein GY803_14065 [Chloroflexi bacterium]|nr:hypothetical protein [Chloroflexota bacterium]